MNIDGRKSEFYLRSDQSPMNYNNRGGNYNKYQNHEYSMNGIPHNRNSNTWRGTNQNNTFNEPRPPYSNAPYYQPQYPHKSNGRSSNFNYNEQYTNKNGYVVGNSHPQSHVRSDYNLGVHQHGESNIKEKSSFDARRSYSVPPKASKPKTIFDNSTALHGSTQNPIDSPMLLKQNTPFLLPQPKNEPTKPKGSLMNHLNDMRDKLNKNVHNAPTFTPIDTTEKPAKVTNSPSHKVPEIKDTDSLPKSKDSVHVSKPKETIQKSPKIKDRNSKPEASSHTSKISEASSNSKTNESIDKYLKVKDTDSKDAPKTKESKLMSKQNDTDPKLPNLSKTEKPKVKEPSAKSKERKSIPKSNIKKSNSTVQNESINETNSTLSDANIKNSITYIPNVNTDKSSTSVDMKSKKVDAPIPPNNIPSVDISIKFQDYQHPNVVKYEYTLGKSNTNNVGDSKLPQHEKVIIAPTFIPLQTKANPVDIPQEQEKTRKRENKSIPEDSAKKARLDSGSSRQKEWKDLDDLDIKIAATKKEKRDQMVVVDKLFKEYECELRKLNEIKALKIALQSERDKLFSELRSIEDESSDEDDGDDDIQIIDADQRIIDVDQQKDIIEVNSSSEEESSSDESMEAVKAPVTETIKMIPKLNSNCSSKVSTKSTSNDPTDNSSGIILLRGSLVSVEPKLDPILVSKQEHTYIVDIKVFFDRLFVAGSHGILRQYDMMTHECVQDYLGHSHIVHSILLTVYPFNTNRLFSGGFDNKLLVHDILAGNLLDTVTTKAPIMSICEGNTYVYYGCSDGLIAVYSLEKSKVIREFHVTESGLLCIASVKDNKGSSIFVGTADGEVNMWDTVKGVKLKNISVQDHKGVPIGFIGLSKQRLLVYGKHNIHFIYYGSDKSPVTFNSCTNNNSLCITKNYTIVGNGMGSIAVHRMKGSTICKIPILSFTNSGSPMLSLTFYNNTIISGDKTGNVYFNRLIEK